MTVQLFEAFDSGRAGRELVDTNELRYIATNSDSETAVLDALLLTAPATLGGMERMKMEATPLGGSVWECTVYYEGYEDDSQYTFETGGGTAHIAQSLQTIARYALPGQTAPDCQGAIGVNGDNVDGTDITVPQFQFSETHKFDTTEITGAYKLALFNATGKVNNATFKGFAAGEVLFLGASGSRTGIKHWEVAFRFAASPNVVNLPVGGITVASKKGWEYLWVRFADAASNNALVKRPVAAYVERVYESADFATLGIGTT